MKNLLFINFLSSEVFLLLFVVIVSCTKGTSDENNSTISTTSIVEIYLLENLDDPRGYCIDIKGSKTDANINQPLQAHTCYSYQGQVSVDQGFDEFKILNNEFIIPFFDVCMEIKSLSESSQIILNPCNNNIKQKFILDNDGKIYPEGDKGLCITISETYQEGGGGSPIHRIRNLSFEICSDKLISYQTWGIRK
ncbi:MAG: hypothetical protein CMC81_07475 [Flavobacteriaceae bacterium]|nr:hypothetical protein [Flavobacteriaceae bacterium]